MKSIYKMVLGISIWVSSPVLVFSEGQLIALEIYVFNENAVDIIVTATAHGVVWNDASGTYPISTNHDFAIDTVAGGNNYTDAHDDNHIYGIGWMDTGGAPDTLANMGEGLYLIEYDEEFSFYLDLRTTGHPGNLGNGDIELRFSDEGIEWKPKKKCDGNRSPASWFEDVPDTLFIWEAYFESGTCADWSPASPPLTSAYTPDVPSNFDLELVTTSGGWNPKLTWDAYTLTQFSGYKLYRSLRLGNDPPTSYTLRATVGTSTTYFTDGFILISSGGGNYDRAYYKLKAYSGSKLSIYTPVQAVNFLGGELPKQIVAWALPDAFILEDAYPNPFNPRITIGYSLPEDSNVSLKVYDLAGRHIGTLASQFQPAGKYEVVWDATNYDGAQPPTGVYIYRLQAVSQVTGERFSRTEKMVLLK